MLSKNTYKDILDKYFLLPWIVNILLIAYILAWWQIKWITSSIHNQYEIKSDPFDGTVFPIEKVPNYTLLNELDKEKNYYQIAQSKFINIPEYNPNIFSKNPEGNNISKSEKQKIYQSRYVYSVPYMWTYNLDYKEYNGSHLGVDIAAPIKTPVKNIANWVVVKVVYSNVWFWNYITVKHDYIPINGKNKTLYSNYAHLNEIFVTKGSKIKKWKIIWNVWNTGTSSWPHLHFQIDTQEAPFHPYWPYSLKETKKAKIPFSQWVNIGLWKWNALLYSIHPMNFIKKYENNYSETNKEIITKKSTKKRDPNLPIFQKTHYYYSSKKDIKNIQRVFKILWYYKGNINGEYKSLEPSIIQYQIDKKIIKKPWERWTWWFGPKTRTQTLQDFRHIVNKTFNI